MDAPPVIEGLEPGPERPWPLFQTFGSGVLLFVAVLVLGGVLAVPAVIVSVMGHGGGLQRSVVARSQSVPRAANPSELRKALSASLPGTSVDVTVSTAGTVVTLSGPAAVDQAGDLHRKLDEAGPAHGFLGPWAVTTERESVQNLERDPLVVVGSVAATQVAFLVVWLSARAFLVRRRSPLGRFHRGPVPRALALGALLGLPFFFLADRMDTALRLLFHLPMVGQWQMVEGFPLWAKEVVFMLGCLSAPVLEEIFFRGLLIGLFQKAGRPWLGVAFSSVVFGLAHMHDAATVVTVMAMGVALGTVYLKTGSLYATIAMHAVNNILTFSILLATGSLVA